MERKKWDEDAGVYVSCSPMDPYKIVDNIVTRYEREIGFRRTNQAEIDAYADFQAMYARLRNEPDMRRGYEQQVEGFSLLV